MPCHCSRLLRVDYYHFELNPNKRRLQNIREFNGSRYNIPFPPASWLAVGVLLLLGDGTTLAWANPGQSDRVTTTSTATVIVIKVVMLSIPNAVNVVPDSVIVVVSQDVGMVYSADVVLLKAGITPQNLSTFCSCSTSFNVTLWEFKQSWQLRTSSPNDEPCSQSLALGLFASA